jgi:hypothetical protein
MSSAENEVAPCPHPRLNLIYAEPNGRWECEACEEVLSIGRLRGEDDAHPMDPCPDCGHPWERHDDTRCLTCGILRMSCGRYAVPSGTREAT